MGFQINTNVSAMSSENNFRRQGDIWALRADAQWSPTDQIKVKFGGRYSEPHSCAVADMSRAATTWRSVLPACAFSA